MLAVEACGWPLEEALCYDFRKPSVTTRGGGYYLTALKTLL